jgi:segregation and condensation protein A
MYRVELQQFEGPMDLLLFFIKRDEIDIYDIPIARIADEYLAYVRVLEEIDLDGVGDFLYMAALLINIKAQMLLPSDEEGEEGEAVDPRRELVERLLEYVRFKEAADQLRTQREHRREHFVRGDASAVRETVVEDHEVAIDGSVYDLVEALGRLLEGTEEETDPVHEVEPLEHSVEEQQRYVLRQIRDEPDVTFRSLISGQSKGFVIATFLAILELARQHYIHLRVSDQSVQGGNFAIVGRAGESLDSADPAGGLRSGPAENGASAPEQS